MEAKAACGHGEWLPWLAAAGVPERTAQRMMKLSAAGFESDTVSDLGVAECLWWLAHKDTLDEVLDACAAYRREFGVEGDEGGGDPDAGNVSRLIWFFAMHRGHKWDNETLLLHAAVAYFEMIGHAPKVL